LHLLGLLLALQAPAGTQVEVPRFEEQVVVDGVLDEDVWSRAAVLSDFAQYEPADGRPAIERTEVRVWYAPDAIYFGIRAWDSEPHLIRATRADRDNIGGDDHVIIYLDTFLDRRRAFFFGVNPLGVQQDGVRTEGAASAGRMFGGSIDRSPDFVFESRGRITADGYTVEVRIPFKSLRYPPGDVLNWGINVERRTQRTGFVDAWPDTRRASASFLAQGGVLTGIEGIRRGVVVEAQPFVTMNAPATREDGRMVRADPQTNAGVNARLGFTSLSLDATVNPDFSQVEADAGQVTVNERFALFLPEKRPFFLEGIELFATPNQLVYTRRIVEPRGGAKLTGKVGPLSIAHLTALDRNGRTGDGDALFNVTRLRQDVGASSQVGITATDRSAVNGDRYNRVVAADTRLVFAGLYYVEGQLGASWTQRGDGVRSGPIWKAEFDRTGRAWGFNYQLNGVAPGFETDAGFVNRHDVVTGRGINRLTWYGENGSALERATVFFGPSRVWRYDELGIGGAIEGADFANASFRLRGDWELGARLSRDFAQIDAANFASYTTLTETGPRTYVPLERVGGPAAELTATTPTFQRFNARLSAGAGRVPIFAEGSAGHHRSVGASLTLRPGPSVRLNLSTTYQRIDRALDGSEFARTVLPRLRAEFQPTRAFFVRGIAEYRAERRADLRDARTGEPLAIGGLPAAAASLNTLRLEFLASFQPTPGTVAFLGYGAAMTEPDSFGFRDLSRSSDGVFLKLAYRIRR
jgi:hypothetical protein